jgi:hypothetical protein
MIAFSNPISWAAAIASVVYIFLLWAIIQTYRLVIHITSQQ